MREMIKLRKSCIIKCTSVYAQHIINKRFRMMPTITEKSVVLNNGQKMPLLGLGCWQSSPGEVAKAVEVALDAGYRHIDTAYNYHNEEDVGRGINNWLTKSGGKRSDLFIVTKLPMIGMYSGGVEKFLRLSLKKLNLPYVDLYLIHAPFGMKGKNDTDVFPRREDSTFAMDYGTDLIAIWKEMEKMVELGLTNSIGISNFSIKQTRKMIAIAKIPPSVNQVELHVYFQQKDLVKFCNDNNIVVTAYAPLGSPGRTASSLTKQSTIPRLLSDPVVRLIADKHQVTPAQILIKYTIQMGIVTIPKSVNPERIKVNGDVFSFTLDDVDNEALLSLDKGEEGKSFKLFTFPGIMKHPEA